MIRTAGAGVKLAAIQIRLCSVNERYGATGFIFLYENKDEETPQKCIANAVTLSALDCPIQQCQAPTDGFRRTGLTNGGMTNMKHSMKLKSLMVAAAVSGLMSGTTALQAATTSSTSPVVQAGHATLGNSSHASQVAKHACKGQNDCKGQGGCKSGDNGCKAKNSCKGKGGCATDGSKMPD